MLCCYVLLFSCNETIKKEDHQIIEVKKTDQPPILDGKANEGIWNQLDWHALDQNWFDYIRSNGVNTDNSWGGLAGDAFERPIFHVEGGIGLFGSASVDSFGLVVLPPES